MHIPFAAIDLDSTKSALNSGLGLLGGPVNSRTFLRTAAGMRSLSTPRSWPRKPTLFASAFFEPAHERSSFVKSVPRGAVRQRTAASTLTTAVCGALNALSSFRSLILTMHSGL